MFGFLDSEQCPIDFSGNAFGAFPGGLLKPTPVPVERDTPERFVEHGGYVYGQGTLTKDRRITVNKTTHRIRFENETENEVTVVIEPKPQAVTTQLGEPR